jgi:DNA topoisomerase-3
VCEKSVGPEKSCDFRSGKMILQQEITPAQFTKLLCDGKTGLLEGFVSSRTNRKFKAYLVKQPTGKIGFEFEARPEKPGDKKGGAKKAAVKKATKTPAKTATKTAVKTPAKKKAAASKTASKAARKTPANAGASAETGGIDTDPPF